MARGYTRVTLPIALTVSCLIASLGPGQRSQTPAPATAGPSVALRRPAVLPANPAGRAATGPAVTRAGAIGRHGVAVQRVGQDESKLDSPREVPELRTRTSATYVGQHGVYTVHQSFESINYQDASGAWQPISNTLIPADPSLASDGFAYQNTANEYKVAFTAAAGGSTLERIMRHGMTLDLAPIGAQILTPTALISTSAATIVPTVPSTPPASTSVITPPASAGTTTVVPAQATGIVSGTTITYPRLFPGTDAQYAVQNDAVKESLILHDATAPSSFTFSLQVGGVHPKVARLVDALGGQAGFVDATGHEQFTLEPLAASDAAGATTPVSLTLIPATDTGTSATKEASSSFHVQVAIPSSWMASPTRVWPIVLDPSIRLNFSQHTHITSTRGYGFFVSSCAYQGQQNCRRSLDGVGLFTDGTQQPAIMRSLVQFDLSPIPPHVTLLNARLQAVVVNDPNVSYCCNLVQQTVQTMNASLYPLTSSWASGNTDSSVGNTTWLSRDGTNPWTTPGGDYDPSNHVTANLAYSGSKAIWNITSLVQQWYLGTRPNDGALIKMDDESSVSYRILDWDGAPLQVIYSYIPWQGGAAPGGARAFDPHAALKSDRSLITFPQGDGQQMGVNVANGDLEIMRNDVSLPSTTTLRVPLGRASDLEAGVRPLSLAARLPRCLTVSIGESSEVTL